MGKNEYVNTLTVGSTRIIQRVTSPDGVVEAPVGSLCVVNPGANQSVWQNYDGGTGWNNLQGSDYYFAPGGTAQGNVFTDWAELVAAYNANNRAGTIHLDVSAGPAYEIPAGNWNFTKPVTIRGAVTAPSFLTPLDGAVLDRVAMISDCVIDNKSSSAVIVGSFATNPITILQRCTIQNTGGGGPFAEVPNGELLRLKMINCSIANSQGALQSDSVNGIIEAYTFNDIGSNNLVGTGTWTVNMDGTSVLNPTQTVTTPVVVYTDQDERPYITRTGGGSSLNGRRAYVYNIAGPTNQNLPSTTYYNGPLKIWNNGPGALTLNAVGGDTVNGGASLVVGSGTGIELMASGTNWQRVG